MDNRLSCAVNNVCYVFREMESKKKQQAISCPKSDGVVAPVTTLARSSSEILVGTLVWGKFKDWPWWPGKTRVILFKD